MPTQAGDPRGRRQWKRLRAQVLADSDVCHLCGRAGATTVDHLVAVSVAPELAYEPSNLAPAHNRCNAAKGNRRRRARPAGLSRDY